MTQQANQQRTLLTCRQVCEALQISKTTLYKNIKYGILPPPIYVARRAVRWCPDELDGAMALLHADRKEVTEAMNRRRAALGLKPRRWSYTNS